MVPNVSVTAEDRTQDGMVRCLEGIDCVPPWRPLATARFFLVLAFLVSGYLGLVALGLLPDLDSDGDFALFARSRWGHVQGIPVALAAVCVHGMTLLLSGRIACGRDGWGVGTGICLVLATMVAAVYFACVQAVFVGELCSWCGVAHGLGVGGVSLLLLARVGLSGAARSNTREWLAGIAVAAAGILAIAGVQAKQEEAPVAVSLQLNDGHSLPGVSTFELDEAILLSLYNGRFSVNPAHFPVIGSVRADAFLVTVTDYTSSECRRLHRQLVELQRNCGEALAIVELPGITEGSGAAEIHRSMLILREIAPHAFTALCESLHASEHLGRLKNEHVRREILKLVPEADFLAAEKRLRRDIDQRLVLGRRVQEANSLHGGSGSLPQLMVGSEVVAGASASTDGGFLADRLLRHTGIAVPTSADGALIPASPKQPIMEIKEATIDLGRVAPGETIALDVPITNRGQAPLQIEWVRFENNCRLISAPRIPIHPGKTADIALSVSIPKGKLGTFERSLTIYSNAGNGERPIRIIAEFDPGKRLQP